jgi:hypothetical protein
MQLSAEVNAIHPQKLWSSAAGSANLSVIDVSLIN